MYLLADYDASHLLTSCRGITCWCCNFSYQWIKFGCPIQFGRMTTSSVVLQFLQDRIQGVELHAPPWKTMHFTAWSQLYHAPSTSWPHFFYGWVPYVYGKPRSRHWKSSENITHLQIVYLIPQCYYVCLLSNTAFFHPRQLQECCKGLPFLLL